MNKRQAKKASRKVVIPFADEMNLLTLNDEEYKKAMKDYDEYVQKRCRFKHYRDKEKLRRKQYFFPVGTCFAKVAENMFRTARTFGGGPVFVHQRYAKGIFFTEGVTIDSETGALEEKYYAGETDMASVPIAVSKQEFEKEIEKFSLRKGK